jgi:hypothetical protein
MLFELLIARYATEIRLKIITTATLAFMRLNSTVLFMCVLAHTARSPSIDVEPLASRQMALANLFWPLRNESERRALTSCAVVLKFIFRNLVLMVFEKMATEAFALTANPKAIFFRPLTDPSNIDAVRNALVRMHEFPLQHLPSARCRPNLLNQLQDLLRALSF